MGSSPLREALFERLHYLASRVRHASWLAGQERLWAVLQPPISHWVERRYARQGILTWVNGVEPPVWLDRSIGNAYGVRGPYTEEPESYQAFIAALEPASCVLDVGASFGLFTLGACTHATAGHVYAFEPVPAAAELLARHVRLNRAGDRVECVCAAVGDREGTCTLYVPPRTAMSSFGRANVLLRPEWGDAAVTAIDVPVTTIDNFCRARRIAPDVIKIDVEGAEVMVLRGARETLARHRPLVFCEIHPTQMEAVGSSLEEFRSVVDDVGYTASRIGPTRPSGIFNARLTPSLPSSGEWSR
jgi:FkbM family methyltransferase